jgi:polar amino acid transport system permease protein
MSGLAAVWDARDIFLSGIGTTLSLVTGCLSVSMPLAMLIHVLLAEHPGLLARTGRLLTDVMRCVPFLLFAYVVYYGLAELGVRLTAFEAGLLSLILYNTAYFIEIFRSAALSVPNDGLVAAEAFGFSRRKLYQRIVFPQILTAAAPVLGNQAVMVIKDSALLMIITVQEITFAANFVSANRFSPFAPFALAMVLYWLISALIDLAVGGVEKLREARYG